MSFDVSDYIDKGLGVVSFLVLIAIIFYGIKYIAPVLKSIQDQTTVHNEVIKNNTEAINQVGRSNDNVATALQLLNATIENNNKLFEKHDEKTANIETEVIKIGERTTACITQRR